MPNTIRLSLLAALPPLLSAVPNIAMLAAAADRLPDPIATHFGANGADGFTGRVSAMFFSAGSGLGFGVLFAVILVLGFRYDRLTRRPDTAVDPARLLLATSWGVGAFVGMLMLSTTVANLDVADAAEVGLPGWAFLLALTAGLLLGGMGWFTGPQSPVREDPEVPARPLPIAATERVSWSGRTSSPWMMLCGVVTLILGVTFGVVTHPVIGGVVILAGVLVAQFSMVRVVVDRRGLTVGTGPLGWPRWQVTPNEIAEVFAADNISPAHYGGYGIRLIPGATAVILRGGPGLVVTRSSGRRLAVTVDDPHTAASVLAGVVQKTR